jgi:hypothetical protein
MLSAMLCGGCNGGAEPPKKSFHGAQKPVVETDNKDAGMVGIVKKAVFDVNKSKPVGKAIEDYRYFTKREWQETGAKNGTTYVDFFGSLDPKEIDASVNKDGVVARSVNIKFVVKQDGTCFVGMVTMYDTRNDGNTYPVQVIDIAGAMNAIYANTKLPPVSVSSDSPWRQTVIK